MEKNGLIIIGQGYYKLKKVNEKFKGTKLKLIISIHSFIYMELKAVKFDRYNISDPFHL